MFGEMFAEGGGSAGEDAKQCAHRPPNRRWGERCGRLAGSVRRNPDPKCAGERPELEGCFQYERLAVDAGLDRTIGLDAKVGVVHPWNPG